MVAHHEPLRAMGPIEWDDVPVGNLKPFMDDVFIDAQTVAESVPSPTTATATGAAATSIGAVFEQAEKAYSQRESGSSLAMAQKLRKEWKEVKITANNPLNISVYKLGAKDGKGAWFARRSVHHGLTFEEWKRGMEMEFPETLKVQGSPGSGNIRGVGADKRVESQEVENSGHMSVFQLSAQFPGPTAPRDFITLLLTTDFEYKPADQERPLRQHVVVSKPCHHDECPPRTGIIRGSYESVEIIREVPIENGLTSKISLLSSDLGSEEVRSSSSDSQEHQSVAVEWLMVTRSDPGGSVPRFMVEKGTPPGIVGDAGKFVKWLTAISLLSSNSGESLPEAVSPAKGSQETATPPINGSPQILPMHKPKPSVDSKRREEIEAARRESVQSIPSSNGIYGIISGVFEAASSVVASGLRTLGSPAESNTSLEDLESRAAEEHETDVDVTDLSETSSIRTFRSALERTMTEENRSKSMAGSNSDESKAHGEQLLEKELRKLQEKRRKLDEKAAHMQQRLEKKHRGGKEKDESAIAKMREKHEKEIAKQEAKYRRELQKLEDKRVHEERKAEARKRKAVEREEKMNLTMELEKTRAERDVALKEVEILQAQVGQLQSQNTMLTAKLGRLNGLERAAVSSSKGSGIESIKG
ncbi:hypothetical protein TASIC1_0003040100 [Trichoderma asperellum]|uniref:DUF3074 domain-containing protein n=1 Tax=Trichoderma asperellum TaxID=101201 RepID=A0A6V8QU96_TRIAP|nr:hypothetical protein TASIC1_0003040100 [Trichoderma asperellum]